LADCITIIGWNGRLLSAAWLFCGSQAMARIVH